MLAASALGQLRPEPDTVVPALMETAQHNDLYVRRAAIAALGPFGNAARPAVPVLVRRLRDPDLFVREAATNVLRNLDPDELTRQTPDGSPED